MITVNKNDKNTKYILLDISYIFCTLIRGFQRPNNIDYTGFIVVYIRSDNTNIFENVNEFIWTEVRITTKTFWSFTDKSQNSKVHLIKLTALLNFILLNLHTFLIFCLLFTAMLLIPH